MRRGTRVGQAYIAITADGSGVNDDIADAFDDVDYRSIGKDHGAKYRESLRKHLQGLEGDFAKIVDRVGSKTTDQWGNGISSRLAKAIETDSALDDGVAKMLAKAFDSGKLDDLIGHVGRKAGISFGTEFDRTIRAEVLSTLEGSLKRAVRSGNLDLSSILRGIDSGGGQIEVFGPLLDEAVESVRRAYAERERLQTEAIRMNKRFDEDREKAVQRLGRLQEQAYEEDEKRRRARERMLESAHRMHAKFIRTEHAMLEQAHRMNERFDRDRVKMLEQAYRLNDQFDRAHIRMIEQAYRLNKQYDREREAALQRMGVLQERALRMNEKFNAGLLSGQGQSVSRNDTDISVVVGRMFGAGSRNNFLNLMGRSMGGIVAMVERAGKFATGFADGMGQAATNASMVQRLMAGLSGGAGASGLSGVFSKIAASGPLAAAGIAAVFVAMTAMASIAGALVGILTAMASTIVTSLAGALLIAGPLIMSVVAAGGLLTAAFTSMTNAQRAYLFGAFKPFKEALTGVGQIIMVEFTKPLYAGRSAIQVWSDNLQRAMVPLAGVAKATARAFADAGNIITAALTGPGFQKFYTSLGRDLPTIVRNLSRALGNFLNGTMAVFAAVLPYVTQFTGYLSDAAKTFSNWANSAEGQSAIEDFVARSVTAIKSLWGFIREFSGFVFDVLFSPAAQNAGNTIFDGLRDAFKKFRKAISNGDLERWFTDAIRFGGQMWAVMKALGDTFFVLYNSGVLTAVGNGFGAFATVVDGANTMLAPLINTLGYVLPGVLATAMTPVMALAGTIIALGEAVEWVMEKLGMGNGAEDPWRGFTATTGMWANVINPPKMETPEAPVSGNQYTLPQFNLGDLISSGNTALNNTYEQYGGYMPDPEDPEKVRSKLKKKKEEWENPYKEFAASLMATTPKLADEIRKAAREARKALGDAMAEATKALTTMLTDSFDLFETGIRDAAKSTDPDDILSSWTSMLDQIASGAAASVEQAAAEGDAMIAAAYAARDQMIASAEQAVQAAAQNLANAGSQKEADAALKELRKAEKNLVLANKKGLDLVEQARENAQNLLASANASWDKVNAAMSIVAGQAVLNWGNVDALVSGMAVESATLMDYAEARRQVAEQLVDATEALVDAIQLRDNYKTQVEESIKSFGSLMTVQARTLNGIAQALTHTDITDNMRGRLEKIKAFNENLRQLLAMGLSDSAYKQILDAGVEEGGALAQALVAGGQGAVSEVNNLTSQIEDAGAALGAAASSHLYQAGVDAAQGLVDGLTSLSAELDAAATALGESIAQAIKDALGIASPSRVLMAMMDEVGNGAVVGLDNQHVKVGSAAARLSEQIAVSPEVAAYASRQGTPATTDGEVSGNGGDPRFRDLIVHTPTEDPLAVAQEVLNEVTGRL